MALTVSIKRNTTGEIRKFTYTYDTGEFFDYIWSEGNYKCDCNRHLFFLQAGGEEEDDGVECGESLYTITEILDKANNVVYKES